MDVQAHIRLFDLIATVYGWFFPMQVRAYRKRVAAHAGLFADCCSILDIGCGTGALVRVLAERGHEVTGIDGSVRMLAEARRRNRGVPAEFRQADALRMSAGASAPVTGADPQKEADACGRYDLVLASFVLHGLRQPQRIVLYEAMKQLARRRVIIMDYNQRRSLLTSLIEWLEGGDYISFIQLAEGEMRRSFPRVTVVPVSRQSDWYICECAMTEAIQVQDSADVDGQ